MAKSLKISFKPSFILISFLSLINKGIISKNVLHNKDILNILNL